MSRPPEHRSLDEVKKLLRSLEETSAADGQPEATAPAATDTAPPPLPSVSTGASPQERAETGADLQEFSGTGLKQPARSPSMDRAGNVPAARPVQRTWIAGIGVVIGLIIGGSVAFLQLNGSDNSAERSGAVTRGEPKVIGSATVSLDVSSGRTAQSEKREPETQSKAALAPEQAARSAAEKLAEASNRASNSGGTNMGPTARNGVGASATPAMDLSKERRLSEGTTTDAQRPPAPAEGSPMTPPMSDAVRMDDAELAHLLAEGQRLWKAGHVAQARLAFRRAADASSAEAARHLGDSYDPAKLFAIGARGIAGDIEKAIFWYERADELGDPHAKARLLSLSGQ